MKLQEIMMEIKISRVVDCTGENCPMPLIKTREAIMKAKKGDVIKVVGTHPQSFEEIPMALEALRIEILEKSREDEKWYIIFKIQR